MTVKQEPVIVSFMNLIRRDIALGELQPGSRLNIEQLKRSHKISHISIREALSQLVGEGYVSFEDKKGFRVSEVSLENLQDITKVRSELECLALEWAIERSNTDWRAEITAAHFALSEIENKMLDNPLEHAIEWDERNRKFHLTLSANCGSAHLMSIIERQYDLTRRYRLMAHEKDKSENLRRRWLIESTKEHLKLKEAVLEGNIVTAKKLLSSHINKNSQSDLIL